MAKGNPFCLCKAGKWGVTLKEHSLSLELSVMDSTPRISRPATPSTLTRRRKSRDWGSESAHFLLAAGIFKRWRWVQYAISFWYSISFALLLAHSCHWPLAYSTLLVILSLSLTLTDSFCLKPNQLRIYWSKEMVVETFLYRWISQKHFQVTFHPRKKKNKKNKR